MIWNGIPTEVYFRYSSEKGEDGVYIWSFEMEVPKGYDGIVIGFYNAGLASLEDDIWDFYTGPEDFALFRMQ